jgi:hypothetical protein
MWMALLAATSGLQHDQEQPEAAALSQPSHIAVTLTSERAAYRSGESVRIKIAVQNVAPVRLDLPLGPPWDDAVLTIRESNGSVVARSIAPEHPVKSGSFGTSSLEPQEYMAQPKPVSTYTSLVDNNGFVNLRGWGYNLSQPGTYTVQAAWFLGRDSAGKDVFARSNQVRLTIND